jgi:hypothetical protein
MLRDISYVLHKFDWMRAERIWPNGLRYLWTDAFGEWSDWHVPLGAHGQTSSPYRVIQYCPSRGRPKAN